MPPPPDITLILQNAASGDVAAANRLIVAVYDQLRAAAQKQMAAERPGHTLSATALVHDAYIKLAGPRELPWQNRAHFYGAAAEAMRRILLDHAKSRGRKKRGGGRHAAGLDENASLIADDDHNTGADESSVDVAMLDDAITRLDQWDPRMAHIVRLKYYAGLEISQVALAVGVSERTVKTDWAFAKAWLQRELSEAVEDAARHRNR